MVLATTPVWVLAFIAIGAVMAIARKPRLDLRLVVLMWALPLGFAVITRTTVYNGWRHFYFIYGPMIVLAAWAVGKIAKKKVIAVILAVCMLGGAVDLGMNHPHQQTYYQPLVRLHGENFNELDYWNVSARDALETLAENTQGELSIAPADLWTEDALQKGLLLLKEETAQRFTVAVEAQ